MSDKFAAILNLLSKSTEMNEVVKFVLDSKSVGELIQLLTEDQYKCLVEDIAMKILDKMKKGVKLEEFEKQEFLKNIMTHTITDSLNNTVRKIVFYKEEETDNNEPPTKKRKIDHQTMEVETNYDVGDNNKDIDNEFLTSETDISIVSTTSTSSNKEHITNNNDEIVLCNKNSKNSFHQNNQVIQNSNDIVQIGTGHVDAETVNETDDTEHDQPLLKIINKSKNYNERYKMTQLIINFRMIKPKNITNGIWMESGFNAAIHEIQKESKSSDDTVILRVNIKSTSISL